MNESIYDRYCFIRNKNNLKDSDVAKGSGVTKSTFSDWKAGRYVPKQEKLQKIADFLGVSLDYLTSGSEPSKQTDVELTIKDERDISKDLENIMSKLSNKEEGPALFDGQELSEESTDLFREELEIALRRLKLINKEKYNPNKNKK